MFIYVIVCNESLKLYVGQHSCKDLQKYLRKKFYDAARRREVMPHLYRAMQKYPQETWSIWPLVSGIETRAELDELEKYYIRVLKAQHSDVGYNIGKGGGCASFESRKGYPTAGSFKPGHKRRVGLKHSEESIRKMSESHRGAPGTWIGRKHSEKSKKKMRASQQKRFAKIPKPVVEYVRSEESRKKMSESHKWKPGFWTGKKLSDSAKKNMSEAQKRRWARDNAAV
jgi:group I intron endonuclease